jgi:chromosome segregation ATPase
MIAETSDIRFECNKCGQHLVVESAGAGLTADCPICNTTVTVPKTGAHTAAKADEGHARPGVTTALASDAARPPFADPDQDELREELIDASLLNGKLVGDLGKAREEIARLQQQLKTVADEREHLNASVTHTQAELKTFQTERQQLKAELSTLRQRLAALEEATTGRDRELEDARARIANTVPVGDLDAVENRLSEARSLAAEWEARAAKGQRALEKANQRATALAEAKELADQQGSELAHELEATRLRLTGTEAALTAAQDQGVRLESRRGELQRQLDEAKAQLAEAASLKSQLDATRAELDAEAEKLRLSEEANQALTQRGEQLRRENDSLRRDVSESHAGRELLAMRDRFEAAMAEQERTLARLSAVEADLRAAQATEAALRDELSQARHERDGAVAQASAFSESRTAKDNEVLRGIIARLNTDLAQRTGEIIRLKRAQIGLKLAYVVFGLGALGVVAFAIKILPHALKF